MMSSLQHLGKHTHLEHMGRIKPVVNHYVGICGTFHACLEMWKAGRLWENWRMSGGRRNVIQYFLLTRKSENKALLTQNARNCVLKRFLSKIVYRLETEHALAFHSIDPVYTAFKSKLDVYTLCSIFSRTGGGWMWGIHCLQSEAYLCPK